jgi:hypothetical protein
LVHENHPDWCEGLTTDTPDELRARKLARLDIGDIFAAKVEGGNSLPFLVVAADADSIRTRCMTSQFPLVFERGEGVAVEIDDGRTRVWRISCMQPLPLEIHTLMLSVDRRMRLGSNGTTNPLDDGDKRALLYIGDHWDAHPI